MLSVSIATFTDIFLYAVIVPVIPFALETRAGVAPERVQYWVSLLVAIYGAALLAAAPFCGWFADHTTTRRAPLLLGLLALAGATVMLCVGSSVGVIIAGRILQGVSAAVVWVVGLALLVDTVGEKEIGQAMGYMGLAMSLGILVGPLLGGVVFAAAGYYAVFAMTFGLIGLDIVLRLVLIEKKVARKWTDMDEIPTNDIPSVSDAGDVELRLQQMDSRSKRADTAAHDGQSEGVQAEDHSKSTSLRHRLPPVITLLSSRRLLAGLWGCLVLAGLLTSFDATLPLFVRNTFGWSSTGAGLIFLALVIPTLVSPLIGKLSDRHGPRWFVTAGFVINTPFLVLLRYVTHDSLSQKVLLCALLFFVGLSTTLVFAPISAEITHVVEAKEKKSPGLYGTNGAMAQAYGLFNMAWAGGTLVGPVWAGMVKERAGWGTMAWSLALLSFVTAFPTAVWTGGLITRPVRRSMAQQQNSAPLNAEC
ncbi:MAG: hypothetical protein Q9157_007017 [Trypethelium eluteriae]